jgi:hypothetical protein
LDDATNKQTDKHTKHWVNTYTFIT